MALRRVGAGGGWLEAALREIWPAIEYVPVDPAWCTAGQTLSDLQSVSSGSVDIAILAFTLHDVAEQDALLHQVARCVRESGHVALLDLSDEGPLAETFAMSGSPPVAGVCRLFRKSPRTSNCVVGPGGLRKFFLFKMLPRPTSPERSIESQGLFSGLSHQKFAARAMGGRASRHMGRDAPDRVHNPAR